MIKFPEQKNARAKHRQRKRRRREKSDNSLLPDGGGLRGEFDDVDAPPAPRGKRQFVNRAEPEGGFLEEFDDHELLVGAAGAAVGAGLGGMLGGVFGGAGGALLGASVGVGGLRLADRVERR